MPFTWIRAMSAARRFGAAVRLQKSGRIKEARDAFVALNSWLEKDAPANSLAILSTRFMSLAHLAQVAAQLGDRDLATQSLEQWLATWAAATAVTPQLRSVAVLGKWEAWVTATLRTYQDHREGNREPAGHE